ncbi:AgrD family cyclic lactone autoinducer peptide [Paenibacillus profundus]
MVCHNCSTKLAVSSKCSRCLFLSYQPK